MLELMKASGRRISDQDIVTLEQKIGVTLPDTYKNFLLRHNGGLPAPDSFPIKGMESNPYGVIQEFLGIDCPINSSSLAWNYQILKGRIPMNLLPIACTPSGDMLCLSLCGADIGEVVLWDCYKEHSPPTYANVYRVAESFEVLIANLFRSPESQR